MARWALRIICVAVLLPWSGLRAETGLVLIPIPGGAFVMGDAEGDANEAPKTVTVQPFRIMRREVTNRQFADFAAESGYRSDVEERGTGWVWNRRWRLVKGADWRHPQGPASDLRRRWDHPVVQISAHDAGAFCAFHGLRLPTEAEWEFAARGSDGRRFPWGDDPPREGRPRRANLGAIKCCDTDLADGYLRTAPTGSYPEGASPFGLLDMAGNVWEWTATPFPDRTDWVSLRGGGWGNNPYCLRTSYRHGNPPHIGLDMVGLRCAADPET